MKVNKLTKAIETAKEFNKELLNHPLVIEYKNVDVDQSADMGQDFSLRVNIDNSKKAVYKTTYDVLVGLSKMIAPIVPFVSENL